MARWTLAVVAVALLAGCGSTSDETFAYDDAPLAVQQGKRVNQDYPVAVHEVSYASGRARVDGFLVAAARAQRVPGLVYVHGAGGNRAQLLVPATWIAARGAVALAVTLPTLGAAPPESLSAEDALRWQHDAIVDNVIAVRHALDLLGADERVDPERLGLVGWSAGGRVGAIVAGIDERVRATVLMSAGASPVSEYADAAPTELRDAVTELLAPIDPLTRIGDAEGALLLQAGRTDSVVPARALRALAAAAPKGTRIEWYQSEHALNAQAHRDQLDWLAGQLGIDGPPTTGAAIGP